jgi:dehydrogenase/reductase SDR family protein 4
MNKPSTNLLPDILKNKKKNALITGASQGIGAEIASSFISKGYFVILVDYNEILGYEQAEKLGEAAKFYSCDLSDSEQVHNLAASLKKDFETIDAIVHNAKAPAQEKDILFNLEKEWDHTMKVMVKHPILLGHLLLELLKKSENASITYIGSTNSQFISHQPLSYHITKGALYQTVRYLACEYGPHKIRVNLLNPGIVDVPGRTRKNPEIFQKIIQHTIPLQRTALAKEVGMCCLFLASEEAKYLTGSSLDLDGGEHLKDHFHLMMSHLATTTSSQIS